MSKALTATAHPGRERLVWSGPASLTTWRSRTIAIALGSALVALCAHIAIPLPWTPIPMTIQPGAVLFIGLLLGPTLGAAAMFAYLGEAAFGLPVLVPGFGSLFSFGATEGYLLAYPLAAFAAGLLASRKGGFVRNALATTAGEAVILLGGISWLMVAMHLSSGTAWKLGAAPFLVGDLLKNMLFAALASGICRQFAPSNR